ncbi:MAG: hypothetical protein QOD99_1370 [Chthoniobacter sp.]|jgi:uncharacterized membrane protein|nr:hypothetical protein [Chthoniobacter sp.]
MEVFEKSIVVNAPISLVYDQWTRVEDFPRFMTALSEVRSLGRNCFRWIGTRDGQEYQSTAELTLQIPERRIAWRNTSGAENSGVVVLEEQAGGQTKVSFQMKYTPDAGWQEPASLEKRLDETLQTFKRLIESEAAAH